MRGEFIMKKQISVFAALCMAVSAAGGMVSVSAEDTTNNFNEFRLFVNCWGVNSPIR